MAIQTIHVFDFDGTLCRTPADSEENLRRYEDACGMPWRITKADARRLSQERGEKVHPRLGWWGRAETLLPPLVPDPTPEELFNVEVGDALRDSKQDDDALTLLLTGRPIALRSEVLRILHDGGLVQVERTRRDDGWKCELADPSLQCFFKGNEGPSSREDKPHRTWEWKCWVLEQFLELHPEVGVVEFWEDRPNHADRFEALNDAWRPSVKVHRVT
ncbi:MAG: HAD domain phosphoesterase family swiss army knife RNA repair protein [Planctomycetales bacterium]